MTYPKDISLGDSLLIQFHGLSRMLVFAMRHFIEIESIPFCIRAPYKY